MRIPRWALLIIWPVAILLFQIALPYFLSLLTGRYGWVNGSPGIWNVPGLAFILVGMAIASWALKLHFESATHGWGIEMTPDYLLSRGPYRYTRNPMYLGTITIWLGWTIFYGSTAVLIALIILSVFFQFMLAPTEERLLEKKFGDQYRKYKGQVPRWFRVSRRQQ